ncbi:MAG: hypothetical protein EHM12_10955 [Dehalococcoidia bacterium]|nr:MAG: hypothetical protein EHM12_10955 [Dehalococcoidia bacterium]
MPPNRRKDAKYCSPCCRVKACLDRKLLPDVLKSVNHQVISEYMNSCYQSQANPSKEIEGFMQRFVKGKQELFLDKQRGELNDGSDGNRRIAGDGQAAQE